MDISQSPRSETECYDWLRVRKVGSVLEQAVFPKVDDALRDRIVLYMLWIEFLI